MPDISSDNAHNVLTYVAIARRRGLLLESCGKVLQEYNDDSLRIDGRIIEELGKFIQHKADELLMYDRLLQIENLCFEDLYQQAIRVQADARKAYLQALEIYTQTTQKRIETFYQHS